MCHGGWVSDVGMIGKNMSRTAKEAIATSRHTSSRTARCAERGEVELLDGVLRTSSTCAATKHGKLSLDQPLKR